MDEEQVVNIALVYNAFDPTNAIKEELLYQEGNTLANYIEGLPTECEWRIGLNAVPVEPENYDEIIPAANDVISVVAVPRGGSAKDILRLVALIAIVVVAAYLFAPMVGGLALAGTGWAAYAAMAAFVMVGSFLVNMALPPGGLKMKGAKDDGQSYGYDGAKNTAREGITLPVVYGEFRVAGNYVDVYTENVGDDQYLYGRVVLSDGEIDSVIGVPEINEQPITNYKNISYGYTKGLLTEALNPYFNFSKASYYKGAKLTTAYEQYTTTVDVDAFEINFVFPQGLVDIHTKTGDKSNESVSVEIQYAPFGTSGWVAPGTGGVGPVVDDDFTGWNPVAPSPVGKIFQITSQAVPDTGEIGSTASYDLQYRVAGSGGAWTTLTTFDETTNTIQKDPNLTTGETDKLYRSYTSEPYKDYNYEAAFSEQVVQVELPAEDSYEFQTTGTAVIKDAKVATVPVGPGSSGSTIITYTDNRTKTIRKTYKSPKLPRGRYHIRYRRTTAEDTRPDHIQELHSTDVVEVQHSNVSHSTVATGWYVAKMTDQLSGIPNITWHVKGVKVDIYDNNGNVTATQWSDNPADIVLDMLIGPKRGALRNKIQIDFPAYVEWRNHCAAEGLKFNGVFDEMESLWDALQSVYRVGRAYPVRMGSRLSVAVDKPATPVMLFGPGNIYKDSFNISYLSLNDRATEFEVSYYDKDDRNKKKTIRIVDPNAAQAGEIPKTAQYELFGVDNFPQAEQEVWYQLYNNRLARRVVSFEAPVESIGLSLGDVALIQHDMVEWGTSGRLAAGNSPTQVVLDKTVDIAAGTYSLLVIHDKVLKCNGFISLATGTTYNLTGLNTITPTPAMMKRLVTNTGAEAAILDFDYAGGLTATVTLDRNVAGTTFDIYDVDVIEERTVATGTGTHTTIDVTAPFSLTPTRYSNYMFGEALYVKRPFRLRAIEGDGFERRTLSFAEYNDFVYSPPEMPIPPPIGKPPTFPDQVTSLTLSVDPIRTGTTATATLSWQAGSIINYAGADIYIKVNNGNYMFLQTVQNTTSVMLQLQEGTTVELKVVGFNTKLLRANYNTAPSIRQVIGTVSGGLVDPTGLLWTLDRIDFLASGYLTWVRGDSGLGNVSPVTRVQVMYGGSVDWIDKGTTNQEMLQLTDVPAGLHSVRIRSENSTGQLSDWVTGTFNVTAPIVPAPTFATTNTAMDHDLNTDGSCNLSVEWIWSGPEEDIDGFEVISHIQPTATAYTLGTDTTSETTNTVPPDKRIFYYYGAACDKWYFVWVRAFKRVHPSFAASGIIYSVANHPTVATEFPYQPDSNVAFSGDVTGTIGGVPVADILAGGGDAVPPGIPAGLALSSTVENGVNGEKWIKLLATWSPSSDPDLRGYVLAIKEDVGEFIEFVVDEAVTSFYVSVLPSTLYTAKLCAYDDSGNRGGFTAEVTHTTAADTVPPAAPTGLNILTGITSLFLRWTNPADGDVMHTQIWEADTNSTGAATMIATVNALPNAEGRFTRAGLATGTTKYYWVKAVDRSGNTSAFSTGASATTAQVGTADIAANSITAAHIAAGTITANEIAAGSITGDRISTGTSLPGSITVGTTGVTIGSLAAGGTDPAAGVNAGTTLILPGQILISGSTTLANWRYGGDLTQIDGGNIAANTITANKVTVGLRGVDMQGIQFQANRTTTGSTSVNTNWVAWSAGNIAYVDNDGSSQSVAIAAGNAQWTGSTLYLYWIKGAVSVSVTTNHATANGPNNVVLATYQGDTDLIVTYGRTIIDGSHISTGTVTANMLNVSALSAVTATIGTFQSAPSGARMVISDTLLQVFDANRLRVRLGMW
jgi:predicted phage tail protein